MNCGFEQPYHSYKQADLVLQDQQAVSLQDLWLHYFCFTQIDLCRACSLTSLVLEYVDALDHTDCELFLPRSLRFFEFRGHAIFAPRSKFKLEDCDSLMKLGPSIMHTTFCYLVAYSTCRSISLLRMTTCGPTAVIGDA